jgi:copper(I)-binding protein
LALASCTPPPPAGIQIFDVWARPAPLSGGTTAVYFRIVNRGDQADRLVGGRAVGAEALEIHETTMERRQAPAPREIDVGFRHGNRAGGFHLMLLGLTNPLEPGDHVALTLAFEQAGEIEVEAEVRQP